MLPLTSPTLQANPSWIVPSIDLSKLSEKSAQSVDAERSSTEIRCQWSQAFTLWLDSRPAPNTRRAYRKAWELFLSFTNKMPWEIGKADVSLWIDHQRTHGLSPETIQQRLAALSSFYAYTMRSYTQITPSGQEQPLHHFNPADAIPRPKTSPYHKARYLTPEQARAFLRAIPRNTIQGLRDYALFLAYLATGRRNSEIRLLR